MGEYAIHIHSDGDAGLYPGGPLGAYDNSLEDYVSEHQDERDHADDWPTLPDLTREQIRAHLPAVIEALGYGECPPRNASTLLRALRPWADGRWWQHSDAESMVNEALQDVYVSHRAFSDREFIASRVFRAAGYAFASHLHENVAVFAVVDPAKRLEYYGLANERTVAEMLIPSLEEHCNWCAGNVWWVEAVDPDGETIESLGGIIDDFYGDYLKSQVTELSEMVAEHAAARLDDARGTYRSTLGAIRGTVGATRDRLAAVLAAEFDAARDALADLRAAREPI